MKVTLLQSGEVWNWYLMLRRCLSVMRNSSSLERVYDLRQCNAASGGGDQ